MKVEAESAAEDPDRALLQPDPGRWEHEVLLLLGLTAALFSVVIAYLGGLDFPFYRDEIDYWDQTLEFIADWPPSLESLRSYGEPMTPLSFLYWGAVELAFGGGAAGLRISCLILSVATLLIIVRRRHTPGRRALLCAIGLLVCPYWVGLSIVIYTDMPAVFLVVLGLWLYSRGQANASAAAFILSIATRQYMVTIPAALLAAELAPAIFSGAPWRWNRVIPLGVSVLSLLGWVVFFGGLGPKPSLDVYPAHTAALLDVTLLYAPYLLSCVGVYFVIPEFLLFRRWREPWPFELSRRNLVVGGVLVVAFAAFGPPEYPMGPLNRAFIMVLPPESWGMSSEVARTLLFAGLAWLTCARFRHFDVVFWLILSRALMMTVVWAGWEKYHLVLLASLWYLRAISDLRQPLELFGLDARLDREPRIDPEEATRRHEALVN